MIRIVRLKDRGASVFRGRPVPIAADRHEWVRRCIDEGYGRPSGLGWATVAVGGLLAVACSRPLTIPEHAPIRVYEVTLTPPPVVHVEPEHPAEERPPVTPPVPAEVDVPQPTPVAEAASLLPPAAVAPSLPDRKFFASSPVPLDALSPLHIAGLGGGSTNFVELMTASQPIARTTVSASPSSGTGTESATAYEQTVRDAVSRELHYPLAARRRGIEGLIQLRLTVDGGGHVTGLEPLTERADEQLVQATVDAVKRAEPFPKPTLDIATSVSLVLPVRFQLTN